MNETEQKQPPWANKITRISLWFVLIVAGVPAVIRMGITIYHWAKPASTAQTYLQQIVPLAQKSGIIMNEVAPLFQNPSAAGSTEQFLSKVTDAKNRLLSLDKEAKTIKPPQELVQTNQQFVESFDKYVEAFQLTERGIKNNDDKLFDQAGDLLIKGANQLKQASEEAYQMANRK